MKSGKQQDQVLSTKQLPLMETRLAVTAEESCRNKIPWLCGRSTVLICSLTRGAACGTGSQKSNEMEEQHWKVYVAPRCARGLAGVFKHYTDINVVLGNGVLHKLLTNEEMNEFERPFISPTPFR